MKFLVSAACLVFLFLSGCAASRTASLELPAPVADAERGSLPSTLREEIDRWSGTPHRWGGITPAGADCSGFVHSVYRDLFGLNLPRTTSDQATAGTAVRRAELQPGDLVFFRPSRNTNHVGIYVSDGHFAHISTSRGLMYSHLDETYWRRAYWTARRVLDHPPAARDRSPVSNSPRPVVSTERRGGW